MICSLGIGVHEGWQQLDSSLFSAAMDGPGVLPMHANINGIPRESPKNLMASASQKYTRSVSVFVMTLQPLFV